jgi:cytochrome P450
MLCFILAGRDTTGSTLSWLLYCLCSHPEKQERVFQELLELEIDDRVRSTANHHHQEEQEDAAQGYDHGSMQANPFRRYAELLTYHNLHTKVPYLHAAIAETLRLHPAVPRVWNPHPHSPLLHC